LAVVNQFNTKIWDRSQKDFERKVRLVLEVFLKLKNV